MLSPISDPLPLHINTQSSSYQRSQQGSGKCSLNSRKTQFSFLNEMHEVGLAGHKNLKYLSLLMLDIPKSDIPKADIPKADNLAFVDFLNWKRILSGVLDEA